MGVLERVVNRGAAFLLEPVGHDQPEVEVARDAAAPAPVVAVCGLAPGCGATTVAHALAAVLAGRHAGRAALVSGASSGRAGPATPSARDLARLLSPACSTVASGRLCLTAEVDPWSAARALGGRAPLVADLGRNGLQRAAGAADVAVLVAGPGVDPALVEVAFECVLRAGVRAKLVRNRATPGDPDGGSTDLPPAIRLPESGTAAALARAGWPAPRAFGAAVRALADSVWELP